jgi:transcriptional regulator GlxA family with amidase domain
MKKRTLLIAGLSAALVIAIAAVAYMAWPQPEYAPYEYGRVKRERLPRMTLLNHQQVMHNLLGKPSIGVKSIGILVYDGVSTLEAVAPMVVFSELMGVKVEYIAVQAGVVSSDLVELVVERSIDQVKQLDVLVVPGGNRRGLEAALGNKEMVEWIRRLDSGTRLTAGVGYGTLLLAEAGLLKNRSISFGWPQGQANALAIGSRFQSGRYTHDGKYWTSVGGTAAIDITLAMLGAIAGNRYLQGAMLDLEYDPAPPFEGGTAQTTPPQLLDSLLASSYRRGELTLLDSTGPVAKTDKPLQVGILVYDGFFTLDVIGPLAVLSQLKDAQVRLIGVGDQKEIKSGRTRLRVPISTSEVKALDMLLIPGGSSGTWEMVKNPEVLEWVRTIDSHSRYTTSVCTGSWVLGAAGLLQDRKASTNWYRSSQMMERFGAKFEPVRYTSDGKYWTSAGVSAGIDMSFGLIAQIAGEALARAAMMRLHYHPEPPIEAGTPEKTEDLVLDMMQQMYDYIMVPMIRQ